MNDHQTESRHPRRDASNRFLVQPLLRLSPGGEASTSKHASDGSKYDVVVVGAGPAGSFLNLLLNRYGLDSVLCIDANPYATQVGHADGIVPRTVEILASLDLEGDLLRYGRHATLQSHWKHHPGGDGKPSGIVRESKSPGSYAGINGRFNDGFFYGMHQGHIERIFEDDLALYTDRPIQRNTKLVSVHIDDSNTEYPVVATLQSLTDSTTYKIHTKYLVGADGAHSAVRNSLGIEMEGDSSDDVYGVIDLVPHTDFPDIHTVGNIATDRGTLLHVVREFRRDGYPLVRMYVPLDTIDATASSNDDTTTGSNQPNGTTSQPAPSNETADPKPRHDYSHITPTHILARANALLAPYTVVPHPSSPSVDWSTTYRVGQRVAAHQHWPPSSSSSQHPRIFLTGDASHTHSPKVGQGLNVSIQDAHNLAWKLAYVLLGLVPQEKVQEVLQSYERERRPVARDLIELDKLWYGTRYKRVREGDGSSGEGQEGPKVDHMMVLGEILGFISGLNLEYAGGVGEGRSVLIDGGRGGEGLEEIKDAEELKTVKAGSLRVGRRLPDARCVRFADGGRFWLQRQCDGRGCWWVVAFAGEALGGGVDGMQEEEVLEKVLGLQKKFVKGTVGSVLLHARKQLSFEWADVPKVVRKECEMNFLGFEDPEQSYEMFGVNRSRGRVLLVRPDGYVAFMEDLSVEGTERMESFLGKVLVRAG